MRDLAAARRGWLFASGAIAESFLIYAFVGWFLARGRGDAPGRPIPMIWYAACATLLVGAVALAGRARAAGDVARFQRRSLAAMALLELHALAGLVLSVAFGRLRPALLLPAASLLVAVAWVIPSGLASWRTRRDTPPGAPPPTSLEPS